MHSHVPFEPVAIADRYELTEHLGAGGMGEVWAGFDRALNRRVAVKLLKSSAFDGGLNALHERFLREAQLLARIGHPAIPAVHDVGTHSGHAYMIMQLIHGTTLLQFMEDEGRPSGTRIVQFAVQICEALSAAHREAVVHRDLKPENLMIDADDKIWLLDFGVAASLAPSDPRLTSIGMASPGTAQYASPEQHLGQYEITGASDLYSLGCVLHELIAGEPLFIGTTARSVGAHHIQTDPTPLRELRPGTPAALERLVLALLAKQPEERPASATDVKAALEAILLENGDDLASGEEQQTAPLQPQLPLYNVAAPTVHVGVDADVVPTLPQLAAEELSALRVFALTAYLDGHFALALPKLQQLVQYAGIELGPDSAESIDLGLVLADIWTALNELDEAEACLRELRENCPCSAGEGMPHENQSADRLRHLDIEHMLGQILHAQGNPESLPLLAGTHASLLSMHGPNAPEVRSLRTLMDSSAAV
ncbi:serine/threonine-protein kinase [Streptomyces tropicalis]|uniref:non-specific serine/threonine protein kinase n=1 Tax=Streptomyces tropicalis TaxID=3034234 RepID=A0ABT6A5Z3_9ACTN|nr:serine/threonine-protein kinase [Streptomyces tropicalis]MDF3300053.1 serine/threonine-protein kinase [Streptomyces tropicalis]